jgi:hypothetical protein
MMFHYIWFKKYIYLLKRNQVVSFHRYTERLKIEHFYELKEDIKEWLKLNKIKYYFYTGSTYYNFAMMEKCKPYIIFKNKSDAVLFKIIWE